MPVHLIIAEGCSRSSLKERQRVYEIVRGSLIEIDSASEIAVETGYLTKQKLKSLVCQ